MSLHLVGKKVSAIAACAWQKKKEIHRRDETGLRSDKLGRFFMGLNPGVMSAAIKLDGSQYRSGILSRNKLLEQFQIPKQHCDNFNAVQRQIDRCCGKTK